MFPSFQETVSLAGLFSVYTSILFSLSPSGFMFSSFLYIHNCSPLQLQWQLWPLVSSVFLKYQDKLWVYRLSHLLAYPRPTSGTSKFDTHILASFLLMQTLARRRITRVEFLPVTWETWTVFQLLTSDWAWWVIGNQPEIWSSFTLVHSLTFFLSLPPMFSSSFPPSLSTK